MTAGGVEGINNHFTNKQTVLGISRGKEKARRWEPSVSLRIKTGNDKNPPVTRPSEEPLDPNSPYQNSAKQTD